MDSAPTEALLQLVFSGECIDGHEPPAVRRAVASALKLDDQRALRLFSGRRVVLRRGVQAAAAKRHIARFAALGAVVRAEPSQPRPARRPRQASKAPPASATGVGIGIGWLRPLKWTGLGVACVVGGLAVGLVLGPWLNAPWPDAPAPVAVAVADASEQARPPLPSAARSATALAPVPAAPAPLPAPAPTTTAAVPVADDEIPPELTPEQMGEYRQRYLPAPGHKAFAIATGGPYAWHAGVAAESVARDRALARCAAAVKPGGNGCRIIDVDGRWLE